MYDELIKRLRDDEAWKNCAFDFLYGWMHEAADAIEELSAIREEQKAQIIAMAAEIEEQQPHWIPVTERLPENDGFTLIFTEHGNPGVCSARLPDKTADGTPIANGKRSVVDCVQRIKAIPAAKDCLEWISVNDRLPELHDEEFLDEVTGESVRYKESNPVLIWLAKGGFMDIGIYEKSDAVDDFCYQGVPHTVTHWMPLPEPPKEE